MIRLLIGLAVGMFGAALIWLIVWTRDVGEARIAWFNAEISFAEFAAIDAVGMYPVMLMGLAMIPFVVGMLMFLKSD